MTMTLINVDESEAFIAKWNGVTASELSTSQSFLLDLCRLFGVETPHPDAEQRYIRTQVAYTSKGNL